MISEKRILKNYFLWFLCFVITMFIGIVRTYAITFTDFTDVHSSTQVLVEYRTGSNPIDWPYNNSSLYQNDVVAINFIISNYSFLANTHYEFESRMLGQYIKNTTTYEVIGANNERCLTDSYYLNFISGEYPRWDFQCSSATNTISIRIFNSNNSIIMNSGYFGWGSAIVSKTTTSISSTGNDTEEIINNANANANAIIDNQNQNTQQQIQSQLVCENITLDNALNNGYLDYNGVLQSSSYSSTTNFLSINEYTKITVLTIRSNGSSRMCFYGNTKNKLSCYTDLTVGQVFTIQPTYKYVRFSISNTEMAPTFELCRNGNQAVSDSINGLNDSLNDDDTSSATNKASEFFSDFTTDTFGLTSIITAPLNLIQSLSSSTCSQLELPLPYLNNKKLILPCMTTIYSQYFGSFFTMYQTITYGIIAYWVIVRIFNLVKDFKNPEHDEIEVVDL